MSDWDITSIIRDPRFYGRLTGDWQFFAAYFLKNTFRRNITLIICFLSILFWTVDIVFARNPSGIFHGNNTGVFSLILTGLFFAILIISGLSDFFTNLISKRRLRQVRRDRPPAPVPLAPPRPVRRRGFNNTDHYTLDLNVNFGESQRYATGMQDGQGIKVDLRCIEKIVDEVVADLVLRPEPFSDDSRDTTLNQKERR